MGGESEREKVRLNCELPRHVTVASAGIPARAKRHISQTIPLLDVFFRERDYPDWDQSILRSLVIRKRVPRSLSFTQSTVRRP